MALSASDSWGHNHLSGEGCWRHAKPLGPVFIVHTRRVTSTINGSNYLEESVTLWKAALIPTFTFRSCVSHQYNECEPTAIICVFPQLVKSSPTVFAEVGGWVPKTLTACQLWKGVSPWMRGESIWYQIDNFGMLLCLLQNDFCSCYAHLVIPYPGMTA